MDVSLIPACLAARPRVSFHSFVGACHGRRFAVLCNSSGYFLIVAFYFFPDAVRDSISSLPALFGYYKY